MELRRVQKFGTTVGLTLPRKFSAVLGLHWKDYVEIWLADSNTLIIKKHKVIKKGHAIDGITTKHNH